MLVGYLMETSNSVNDISEALCKQSIEPGTKKTKINPQPSGVTQSIWGKETKYIQKKYCQGKNTRSKQEVETTGHTRNQRRGEQRDL